MVEVIVDSVRVSLMSQHRVVVLKDIERERYLPIWIGPFEADAITIELHGIEVARPLTHDLLNTCIAELGGEISHVLVNDLRNDTFYARIFIHNGDRYLDIDSRPSDAIALAVRAKVPIFVAESVMEEASITPEEPEAALTSEEEDKLSVFRDFLSTLDVEDLGEGEG